MQILLVSPRQCWPTMGGSKQREYHAARALGEHATLTYLFFRDTAFPLPGRSDMPFCERIVAVPRPQLYSPGRIAKGLLGRWPLPIVNYTSGEMQEAIRAAVRERDLDVAHFEGVNMAAYIPMVQELLPGRPIVFNWHNIESEAMERYAESAPSAAKRAYARLTAGRLAVAEDFILRNTFGNFVCSDRERALLAARAPKARIAVSENGVDTNAFCNNGDRASGSRNRVLFVGLMAYHANADAALWFAQNIWPALRQRMPDRVLTIVGAEPGPAVVALAKEPGIEVTGTVPNVKPYYDEAFAAIVPLRVGAGTRLKILEAMAAGAPVVSTAVGAEGLAVRSGENILLAETADEWIEALAALEDEERRQRVTAAAQSLVASRYDWAIIRRQMFETYTRWLKEGWPAI